MRASQTPTNQGRPVRYNRVVNPDNSSPGDSKKSTLASNIFWMYGLQGLNYLIPAAMLPYLVRVLGIEQYGLIAFTQAIAQYFIIATDYGFNFSASRTIAQNHGNHEEVSRVFWTTITIKLMLLALGAAMLGAAVLVFPRLHENASIYFAAYVAVIGNAIFPLWLFQGIERMRSISIITGLGKLFSALLVVLLVHKPQDTFLATLLLSSGFLFAGIAGMTVALRHHVSRYVAPSRTNIYTALRDGRHLFLTTRRHQPLQQYQYLPRRPDRRQRAGRLLQPGGQGDSRHLWTSRPSNPGGVSSRDPLDRAIETEGIGIYS
jgi:PST family polysaccharide transporter